MIQSMSRKGNCWDNAPDGKLLWHDQNELVHHACYPTREAARMNLFAYIEGYYNRQRLHSASVYHSEQQSAKPLDPVSTKSAKVKSIQKRPTGSSHTFTQSTCATLLECVSVICFIGILVMVQRPRYCAAFHATSWCDKWHVSE